MRVAPLRASRTTSSRPASASPSPAPRWRRATRRSQAGNRGKAAVAIRGAEEAVGQAGQLLDAIDRLETDLADADDKIRAAIPDVVEDITAARALAGESPALVEYVARAEQALAAAELAASTTDGQDPLGALHRLEEAGKALDTALADAREDQEQARRARAALEQTLSGARAKIEAADDFITTRRGAVGAEARTRLAEAKRHFEQSLAVAGDDAQVGLEHARTADGLAEQALRLAQQDVSGYERGPEWASRQPGGGGGMLGDVIMGGILIDLLRGGGGGGGWSEGGGGGWDDPRRVRARELRRHGHARTERRRRTVLSGRDGRGPGGVESTNERRRQWDSRRSSDGSRS